MGVDGLSDALACGEPVGENPIVISHDGRLFEPQGLPGCHVGVDPDGYRIGADPVVQPAVK